MSDFVAQATIDTTALLCYLTINRPEIYQASVGVLLSTKSVIMEGWDSPLREEVDRLWQDKKLFLSSPSLDSLARLSSKGDQADRLSCGELSALALADQIAATLLTDPQPANMKAETWLDPHRVLETVSILFEAYKRGELTGEELDGIEASLEGLSLRFRVPLRRAFEELTKP